MLTAEQKEALRRLGDEIRRDTEYQKGLIDDLSKKYDWSKNMLEGLHKENVNVARFIQNLYSNDEEKVKTALERLKEKNDKYNELLSKYSIQTPNDLAAQQFLRIKLDETTGLGWAIQKVNQSMLDWKNSLTEFMGSSTVKYLDDKMGIITNLMGKHSRELQDLSSKLSSSTANTLNMIEKTTMEYKDTIDTIKDIASQSKIQKYWLIGLTVVVGVAVIYTLYNNGSIKTSEQNALTPLKTEAVRAITEISNTVPEEPSIKDKVKHIWKESGIKEIALVGVGTGIAKVINLIKK